MNVSDIEEYAKALLVLQRKGRIEDALRSVTNFVLGLTERESTFGRLFGSEELDEATNRLGALSGGPGAYRVRPRSGVVVLGTALYGRGGHTGSLSDLLAVDNGGPTTVLLTNVGHNLQPGELAGLLPGHVDVEIAPGHGLASRMRWVQDRLKALRPERTYLFHHPYDAVAVAAAQPALLGDAYFYHHADHGFSLGLYSPKSVHIDPTPKIFHHCRSELGLVGNVYWPLTAPEPGPVSKKRPRAAFQRLVTCCTGGIEKFENVAVLDRVPYRISYPDAVATILRTTGGQHVHIGPLSDPMLDQISDALDASGLSASNFVHIPETSDLPEALRREGVDIYMGSFPRGGGRALIGAMSVGLPMILHANYRGRYMSDVTEAYPGVLSWTTLPELKSALKILSRAVLDDHAKRSRQHYEAWHRPAKFKEAVDATLAGEAPPVPARSRAYSNMLQAYLDEQQRDQNPDQIDDMLSLLLERNEGWKTLGGPVIEQTFADNNMYSGILGDGTGIYLHAGRNGQMTVASVAPADGRGVKGLRANIELADSRSAAIEYAVAGVRSDVEPDLLKVSAWLSSAGPKSKSNDYFLLSPWQKYGGGEPETLRIEWHQRRPLGSVIIAVRMAGANPSNAYAMLSFRELEWRAAPMQRRSAAPAEKEAAVED